MVYNQYAIILRFFHCLPLPGSATAPYLRAGDATNSEDYEQI